MLMQSVESYLAIRRAAGFQLRKQSYLLRSFAKFAEARKESVLYAKTAIEWAELGSSSFQRARRLCALIHFARYLRAEDPRHEIPPEGIFGSQTRPRAVPYIFSPEQIHRIIGEASRLKKRDPLLPHTFSTLFSLLACTGLRVSEALKLRRQDLSVDGLVIRESKFRKTRLVPLHVTARAGLERYLALRQRLAPCGDDNLFVNKRGRPLHYTAVGETFRKILRIIRLGSTSTGRHPTLHSMRHTFATRALEACSDRRDKITKHTVALSNYLGHYNVAATYWYLEATPTLMADIVKVCENFVKGITR